eukprot:28877-Pyramimonas_sp.AAC.1
MGSATWWTPPSSSPARSYAPRCGPWCARPCNVRLAPLSVPPDPAGSGEQDPGPADGRGGSEGHAGHVPRPLPQGGAGRPRRGNRGAQRRIRRRPGGIHTSFPSERDPGEGESEVDPSNPPLKKRKETQKVPEERRVVCVCVGVWVQGVAHTW